MDKTEGILLKILSNDEHEKIPNVLRDKLEKYFSERLEEFLTSKAIGEAAKNNIDKVREEHNRETQELQSRLQDYEAKLDASQKNVDELRTQLDGAREEIRKLLEKSKQYEIENAEYRRARNDAVDERDSLLNMVERRNAEVERLQSEIKTYESQLQSAIGTKCEALAKLDEIEGKEVSLNFKERRMEQEKTILTNQINSLSDDLNRKINELQTIRRENTLRHLELETKLSEKTEELKIANSTIEHLNETVGSLSLKAEDLTAKLLEKGEEISKMMAYYRKELDAKTKLADLYREQTEDQTAGYEDLTKAITDLKKLLNEATEQYGALETKMKENELKYEQDLEEKENVIKSLRDELIHANDLLKETQDESKESALAALAPTAAVTSRLAKLDFSLTEIYSMYVKASEELRLKQKENDHLELQMASMIEELKEKAPVIQKQTLEYNKLRAAHTEALQKLDDKISQLADLRFKLQVANERLSQLERENQKLHVTQKDLARQVCVLLNDAEMNRAGGSENEHSISSDMSANEVISKKLITFHDIKEMQENNEKLILLVRDLSSKLEEIEDVQNSLEQASYESKITAYKKQIDELQTTQVYQTQMLNTCMQQRDRYKKLYNEVKSSGGNVENSRKVENIDASQEEMEGIDDEVPIPSSSATSSVISSEALAGKEKRIQELEDNVNKLKEQLKKIKEEYDDYRKERATNEKMLNEQFDSMRTECRELTSSNCKLLSNVENLSEQIQIQQKNVSIYKKQIQTLEERNRNYENTIIKHEQTLMMLKDETFRCQKELASKTVQCENLKQENRILHDAQMRLQLEHEALHRERKTQSMLMNDIEMIKNSFERSENEGRLRTEARLDEVTRECSALRRRLQEEQDHFRELSNDMKRQTETAKQRMNEEKAASDGLRDEINKLREELLEKTKQVDDLSKKLQESLTPSKNDNPILQANKKAREMELKFEEASLEVEALTKQLEAAKEHGLQYCNIAQSTEKELKDLHDVHSEYKTKAEEELKRLRLSEANLKTRVDELETEIQMQITNEKINSSTTPVQMQKVRNELTDAMQKINELSREVRDLREQNNKLGTSLNNVEQKYANEMILHSTDIQQLTSVKEELNKVREQISSLKIDKEKALAELSEKQKGWEEYEMKLSTEREEIEKRLVDLDSQNSTLHDQLQALSTKLSVANVDQSMNESANDSTVGDQNISIRSINEDEVKSNAQLLQIIKYLRKEKDISMAKLDIFRSENARLLSELTVLQKKVEELNSAVNNERSKSDVVAVTTARHEEILRKVETLNAITDSNRILREERDALAGRVKELIERVSKVEDELFPLQEKNRELTAKIEESGTENNSLRTEALRWRQRANLLVERSNKNPEDFKRLQNERENLAKMLTAEKELVRKAQEELNSIKVEKNRLEAEVANVGRQLQTVTDEKKKIFEDFSNLRQQNIRLTHEVMELKNYILEKDDELKKITEELAARDVQLTEAKNKEFQIRKIAKRYKDSFIELKSKEENKDTDNTGDGDNSQSAGGDTPGPSKQDVEKELKDKINELNAQIATIREENENVRKENENLKETLEKEGKNCQLLLEANSKIMNLQVSNSNVTRELDMTKVQLQSIEQQTREEHEIALASVKQQYESRISRQEKDHSDQEKELKETVARITRENETLIMRINQLHRQLGQMQQTSKPSTSSGQSTDKSSTESPRTANVKPMSGPSGQQSATVTPWRGGETPLASIRPMSVQNSRTAAVLPTSQTSNVATIQGSSSSTSGSVTALVPPQQQVHTTGNSSGEAMSSSPTSSHTDYMPATSSAAVVVAAIPPMGANAAESSQEAESVQAVSNESSSSQLLVSGGQQQQAVALVSPRVEGTSQNTVPPQLAQAQDTNQPSTSGTSSTSSTSNISVTSHHQASSSNTVTTTQAGGHKRPRDVEGDSSTSNEEVTEKPQQNKRTRMQTGEATFQGVSESGLDVEYQVPTSSQRDQEDDVIIVDSEDDGMVDEGPADADDDQMEDEADNGEGYEMEESYEQEQEIDEGEGPDIDEDNVQSNNNEVEVDDSSEVPNQSGTSSSNNHVAPDAGTSTIDQSSEIDQDGGNRDVQQIQTISSGTNEAGSSSQATPQSCWRHVSPLTRQQQQTVSSYLMLQQSNYEETGDDGIVPSTPTLYVPRRADGFSEAVSSPHPQVPHGARFTFSESSSTTTRTPTSVGVTAGGSSNVEGGIDETRIDLTEEAEGSSVPSTVQQTTPSRGEVNVAVVVEGSSTSSTDNEKSEQVAAGSSQEAVAGPSHMEGQIPEITVTTAAEDVDVNEDATTSDANDGSQLKIDDEDIEEEEDDEGLDGVTSEGEKPSGATEEPIESEEGREAEASTSPTVNTRSRSIRNSPSVRRTNRNTHQRGNRPTPIIWQEHSRTPRNMNMNQNIRGGHDVNMPPRGAFQPQRGPRSRRMRRGAGGQHFGGNMRY